MRPRKIFALLYDSAKAHTFFAHVHVPNFGGLSGSQDRGGGDNSIQFINFGRVGDKVLKNGDKN